MTGPATTPKKAVLVEASAGTGKTYRITDRVTRLVAVEDVAIDRILCVTFTEAATAELRDRIRTKMRDVLAAVEAAEATGEIPSSDLAKELAARDAAATRERLARALRSFDEAEISTIHGFCHRVLKRHAFESDVDLDAELVTDVSPIVRQIVEDFWVRRLHDAPVAVLRGLAAASINLRKATRFAMAIAEMPDAAAVVTPPVDGQPLEEAVAGWQAAFAQARDAWAAGREEAIGIIWQAVANCRILRVTAKSPIDRPTFDDLVAGVDLFFSTDQEPDAALPSKLDPVFRCKVKQLKKSEKGKTGNEPFDQPSHPVFDAFGELIAAGKAFDAAVYAAIVQLVSDLVASVPTRLKERKAELHVLTFTDLLTRLRDALEDSRSGPFLRKTLAERYDAALVDEFQDTDPVQWAIFGTLFTGGGHWLDLIGDPKQAIYSFRGADIQAYVDAKNSGTVEETADKLTKNYRSDERLVQAVNALFEPERLPEPFLVPESDITYHPITAHHTKSRLALAEGRAPLEIRFCRRDGAELNKKQPGMVKGWASTRIARWLAADVGELLAAKPTIEAKEGPRELAPRDVAILVRTNRQARLVQDRLRERGIPSVLHGAGTVFASEAARELSLLLAAVLEPASVPAVKTALSTELWGTRSSTIATFEDDLKRWEEATLRLRRWRTVWLEQGLMRTVRLLLDELRVPERVLGWHDGERRLTDLLHAAELVHAEAAGAGLGPEGALAWLHGQMDEAGERAETDAAQLRLESDADAVEILTIHKSKGLQFPVVYCPFLWSGSPLPKDKNAPVRYHDETEKKRKVDLTPRNGKNDGGEKGEHRALAKLEVQEEDLRLAYVALTRAEHHTVVYWGWVSQGGSSPLDYLFHGASSALQQPEEPPDDPGAARMRAADARFKEITDAEMLDDLEELAAEASGTIGVRPLSLGDEPPLVELEAASHEAVVLDALPWDPKRRLDTLWRRGSFSALTKKKGHDPDAGKEDDEALDDEVVPEEAPPPAETPEVTLTREVLRGGRRVGSCLHEIYEHLDFQKPETVPDVVGQALGGFGLDEKKLHGKVCTAVEEALKTPLTTGDDPFCLGDVPPGDRLNELDFDYPVVASSEPRKLLTPDKLRKVFADHRSAAVPPSYPARIGDLRFANLCGVMNGAIDLVFRRAGRWYVADFKSNWLGDRYGDYRPDRLAVAMAHGHYYLQYHLYALALHRHLRWRLEGYDYERHFGGVYYLFLRGLSPGTGPEAGVFFDKPTASMMEALDELMRTGREGGAS